jgi:raffinose/stachyose/melibiose transport system substrate-binding protein
MRLTWRQKKIDEASGCIANTNADASGRFELRTSNSRGMDSGQSTKIEPGKSMRRRMCLAAAAVGLIAATAVCAADTIKWLHVEVNPQQIAIWRSAADAFESQHPGVKIEPQYLENEAFKSKLTTLLQSRDKPAMFYSWAGGVLRAQTEAGVVEDLTNQTKGYIETLTPTAVAAFTIDGHIYGVPQALTEVGFFYNRSLFAKAGVDAGKVKTWDDFLGLVKQLKAAGITPLTAGGADKWPLSFFWSYLALRQGGKAGFEAALKGENGGFAGPDFVKAGENFKQLVDLQPFQPGFLGDKHLPAIGLFADGKAAMTLAISVIYNQQHAIAADKKGLADDQIGWLDFPTVPGGQGLPTDTLGGIVGWVVSKDAPKETVPFIESFVSPEVQSRLASAGFIIPVVKGASDAITSPFLRHIADELARSTYHQNFYDQVLGPSVGRTVNDVVAQLAGGSTSPQDAAAAVQAAFKQGN